MGLDFTLEQEAFGHREAFALSLSPYQFAWIVSYSYLFCCVFAADSACLLLGEGSSEEHDKVERIRVLFLLAISLGPA